MRSGIDRSDIRDLLFFLWHTDRWMLDLLFFLLAYRSMDFSIQLKYNAHVLQVNYSTAIMLQNLFRTLPLS